MLRGRKRAAPQRNMELEAQIHNRFDVEVVDASTGEVRQRARAYNVICDQMWAWLLGDNSNYIAWNKYLHYGSGTGTPSSTDTSLFRFNGYLSWQTGENKGIYNEDNLTYSLTRKAVLLETMAVGLALSEVGIGIGTTASTLCTHAMLQDMNGNQITIQKTSTDIINIYATVFVHLPPEAGEFIYVGANSSFFSCLTGTSPNFMSSALVALGGRCVVVGTITVGWKRDINKRQIILNSCRMPAAGFNGYGGFTSVIIQGSDMRFNLDQSWYASTQIKGDVVGTGDGATKDYSTTFGFVEGVTVYVDGTPVQGVSVETGWPGYAQDWFPFLTLLDESGKILRSIEAAAGQGTIVENKFYGKVGIKSISGYRAVLYASNDREAWTRVFTFGKNSPPAVIQTEHQYYRYWKCTGDGGIYGFVPLNPANLHFSTPPAAGAVITADYTSKSIAKDADHVFDFNLTIQLGERSV